MQRTVKRILLIAAAFALFVVPAAAIAAAGFTDVADSSIFVSDIQWMKDNDITRGCNPPTNDRFCPSSNVTREQMSAFMHRLATNQVVDAATALEADHATSADNVDGYDAHDIVAAYAWDVPFQNNITTVREVFTGTITAPTAGVLVVNTSLSMADDADLGGIGTAAVSLKVEGTTITYGSTSFGASLSDSFRDTLSLSSGVAIPAGTSAITIEIAGGAGVFLYNGAVNAIFTPFGGTSITLGSAGMGVTEQP